MIRILLLTTLIGVLSVATFAQKHKIYGVVRDAVTAETLIGANILVAEGTGTVTDFDGNFAIEVEDGEYNVQISYVGYDSKTKKVNVAGKDVFIKLSLETITLNEVNVVADVARARETPVAFTNVLPAKIEEELAGQDIPMLLNSTPGVYATQQGGGDGDARINIRGFNQRNVAVMIDGIPVNDMENGWVYWSNWSGLDVVIRTIQVQRGLSASKLALPSVGGTMNILTESIDQKRKLTLKEEVGSGGMSRTTLGFNSGRLKNGWGVTFAGSYKRGNGFVDETWTRAWFYYAKIQKQVGSHIISLTATGSPQEHGQRKYEKAVDRYDSEYARELGIDPDYYYPDVDNDGIADDTIPKTQMNNGLRYNRDWGYLNRWEWSESGDTVWGDREKLNQKVNYYHKPAFSLRDFWNVNDKFFISNIAYLSLGNGGGTGIRNTPDEETGYDANGQLDLQAVYDNNNSNAVGRSWYSLYESIGNPIYQTWPQGVFAGNYLYSSRNNHFWYGLLSTFEYKPSNLLTFSGGVDLRSYKGEHYREIYDMLGAEYED
jgi:carboxypeptidase-like protein/TonB-dependent receptor-like protein